MIGLPTGAVGDVEIGIVQGNVLVIVHADIHGHIRMLHGIELQGFARIDDTEHGGCSLNVALTTYLQHLLGRGETFRRL